VQKLRELILTFAMQGKLVPQDPTDQPASELLKEIEAEKQRLVKEGKIKQQKPLPEITLEEIPYQLPESWEWVRLGSIATKLTDGSHSPPRDSGTGYPMLSSQNVNFGKIDFSNPTRYVGEEDFCKEDKRTNISPNDVLLTIVASLGRPAVVPDNAPKFVLQRSVAVIKTPINSDYLCRYLGSPISTDYYLTHGKGTAQKGIYLGQLNEMLIAVPPLAEQKRIVAKIDRLMAQCDDLENLGGDRNQKRIIVHAAAINRLLAAQENSDFSTAWDFIQQHFSQLYSVKENVAELRKAILQLAVMGKLVPQDPNDQPASELLKAIELEKQQLVKEGRIKQPKQASQDSPKEVPYKLPGGWEWVRVIDIVDVGTGSTPTKANLEYYNGHIPWYTSSSTNNLIAETPETFITEKALKETNCKVFPAGSLIVALYGQGKTRGQISEIVVPGATNQAIAAMVFYETSMEIKRYVKYYFIKIYDELRSLAEGAAQPNLNVGKIKETLIPLPPFAEQQRIVAKVDRLMALCDRLEQQIDAATDKRTELLNALMAQV
jgi:type I restriction enzyme, S subunit